MEVFNKAYTLKNCSFILDSEKILENVNIVIENGKIKNVGNETEGDEIDCSEYVVTPGFVNSHTHSAMIFLRGYYDDNELQEWLDKMWEKERTASRKLLKVSSELAVLEMLSSGTTAFVDMYFNPEDIVELSQQYGIRAAAGYTFLDEIFDPEEVAKMQGRLQETKLFKPIVNVHSVYATSEKTLLLAKDLAEEENTWINIHLSETRKEIYETKLRKGKFPVEYLQSLGIAKFQAVHLGWVASWEIEMLKNSIAVTHCPTSNMKLATAGAFPFYEMLNSGINVTIGTDGPASNNSLDIIREMKNAVLLQRHSYWDTRIKALHVFRAATENGYKLLRIKGGLIKEGYVADLVLFNKNDLYPLKKDRILSNIIYFSTKENISKIIINGKIIDKETLRKRIYEVSKKLNEMI
ncbi:amidohydrolase [Acidianus sp. HS-5]|uniref:amidohydrolase n=1 Tax=Acidianus sp. HS-5 TaxID=2886040 RepID=UPI001F1F456D|nr:amidohydrolase [Acidianus sp. HS-5]BDC19033.1 N-ethylammeline chlorohydrolase [Acidianus sp. HS-5]